MQETYFSALEMKIVYENNEWVTKYTIKRGYIILDSGDFEHQAFLQQAFCGNNFSPSLKEVWGC